MGYFKSKQNYSHNRINYQITAPTVRLIDEHSKQINIMSLAEAKAMASDTGLDLVEIAPKAVPPVVKLISFSKFKYQEAKKLQSEKKGVKGGEMKEIQMTPFIGQNDYDIRVKKAQKFFTTGNKVKLSIKFQGRQMSHKEFGFDLINKFKTDLKDFAVAEGEPKLLGRNLLLILTPIKNKHTTKNEETK